ncbi:MAG: hypothetical protein LBR90_00525, partial [Elusimicrobiota bacterium]|nr:hypothetical protein [Elusimicrobiota bacterium]
NLFQARDFEEPPKYSSRAQEETTSAFTPLARQEKQEGAPAWWQPPYNYLGQMHNSYLIFENPNGLVLVDQHAAQERVFFEEYLNSLENASTQKQPLMFPVSVDMAASDIEALLAWQEVLDKAGFEISRFSPRTILINTVPNILKFKEDTLRDFIISLANVIGAPSKSGESLKYKLIAAMACKKSIKAGQPLESAQAGALMQNLKTCLDGLHCPHGRPTIIEIGIKEVNKKFQRG